MAGLLAANTSKMTTEACAYRTSPVFPRRDPGFPGAAQRFPRGVKAGGQRAFGLELRRRDNSLSMMVSCDGMGFRGSCLRSS